MVSLLISLCFSGSVMLKQATFPQVFSSLESIETPIEDIVIIPSTSKKGTLVIKGTPGKLSNESILVEIFNLKGKKVKEIKPESMDGTYEFQVDTLQEGEYILTFTTVTSKFQSRLIITD